MNHGPRRLTFALVGMLAIQFVLGMVSNFYAKLPTKLPGEHGNLDNHLAAAARWALLHGPVELQAHVALGLALGIGAITLTARSIRRRSYPWLPLAPLGLVAVVGAGLGGAAFLAYDQRDLYSLLMSIAFLAALFIYGDLLYLTRPADTAARGRAPEPATAKSDLRGAA
jgi:uncharacterized membrane protein YfcA